MSYLYLSFLHQVFIVYMATIPIAVSLAKVYTACETIRPDAPNNYIPEKIPLGQKRNHQWKFLSDVTYVDNLLTYRRVIYSTSISL